MKRELCAAALVGDDHSEVCRCRSRCFRNALANRGCVVVFLSALPLYLTCLVKSTDRGYDSFAERFKVLVKWLFYFAPGNQLDPIPSGYKTVESLTEGYGGRLTV